mgnify:CR=1 FL=1
MNDRENNRVKVIGTVVGEVTKSHEFCGETFYQFDLKAERTSGTEDILPCMVSDRLCNIGKVQDGTILELTGQLRSFNLHTNDKTRAKLILSVFGLDIQFLPELGEYERENNNGIELIGWLCKAPSYRITPFGREIADILVAVNRPYGKSDYIPCIVWGRNARFASGLEVGTNINIKGRVQSRNYTKMIDGEAMARTAYEVSVSNITAGALYV